MIFRLLSMLRFGYLPDGAPPIPGAGGGGMGGGNRRSDDNGVVGGFAYTRDNPNESPNPIGGLSPASATFPYPTAQFDPYRQNDMRRILQMQVNQGGLNDLQLALVQAGLLDRSDITPGYLGDDTQDAFSNLLAIANQNGMDWRDVLSQMVSGGGSDFDQPGGGGGGGGGGGLAPTIIQLPNRDDLVANAEDTGLAMTGHRLDDDLQGTIADSVLDALRTQQERQYQQELGITGQGLHFTEGAPDVQRLTEEAIEEERPGLVMERGVQDAMNSWFAALRGPV